MSVVACVVGMVCAYVCAYVCTCVCVRACTCAYVTRVCTCARVCVMRVREECDVFVVSGCLLCRRWCMWVGEER